MFGENDPKARQRVLFGTIRDRFSLSITYSDIGLTFYETDTGNSYIVTPTTVNANYVAWLPFGGVGNPNGNFLAGQNQLGVVNQAFVAFGDSYIAGNHTPPTSASFAYLTAVRLNAVYPTIKQINYGIGGANSTDMISRSATDISNIPGNGFGPMAFGLVMVGINNLRESYALNYTSNNGPACCNNQTLTFVNNNNISQQFKKDVKGTINLYLATYPGVPIVLCTIIDPTNGGLGPDPEFAGWTDYLTILALYNTRLKEIAYEMNIPLADTYTAMFGHPEWFDPADNLHPNNMGDFVMAMEVQNAFASAALGSLGGSFPNVVSFDSLSPATSFAIPQNSSIVYSRKHTKNAGIIVTKGPGAIRTIL